MSRAEAVYGDAPSVENAAFPGFEHREDFPAQG